MLDLLIAGAGPAGLATALYAARAGLDVAVCDPRPAPIDKACGEGLMPHTVRLLSELGVPLPGRAFHGIRYLCGDLAIQGRFTCPPGLGVRRTVLHTALRQAALAAGVPILARPVREVRQDADVVRAGGLRARYLAAADGLHSPIRSALGLERPDPRPSRWGLRRHFEVAPWTDLVEVHFGSRSEAYVTPVSECLVGVAVLGSQRRPFDDQLAEFTALAARLGHGTAGEVRGAGPLRRQVAARVAGRVLLVGDAAGYLDALTGEGIGVAVASARELVRCVRADRPGEYERAYDAATRTYRLLTATLLRAIGRPLTRRALVPAAAGAPPVFRAAVNLLGR